MKICKKKKRKYKIRCYICKGDGYLYFPSYHLAKFFNAYKGNCIVWESKRKRHKIVKLTNGKRKRT